MSARKTIEDKFSEDIVVNSYKELYAKLYYKND